MAGTSVLTTIAALANEPGRMRASRFGTSASTSSVRLPSAIAGLSRTTVPSVRCGVAIDRDLDLLSGCDEGRLALRHLEAEAQRIDADQGGDGHTGRHVLADGRGALADHPVEGRGEDRIAPLLAGNLELRAALGDECLPVAHLLEGVLVAALGHLQRGLGRIELRTGRQAARDERLQPIATQLRFVEHGTRLAHDCRLEGIDDIVRAGRIESESGPRLLQGGVGLSDAQREVSFGKARDGLPCADPAAEIDQDLLDAAGDLEAEDGLLLGGQGAADDDRLRQGRMRHRHEADFVDGRGGRRRGRRGT